VLRFAPDTNTSLLRWGTRRQYSFPRPLPDLPVARVLVAEGAYPLGSQWARNPVPPCKLCTAAQHAACFSEHAGGSWIDQQHCSQSCVGENMTACPPGMTHFPEPLAGVSGFYDVALGFIGFPWSIVDRLVVPAGIEPGAYAYVLGGRWDAEHSQQVWQNCADVQIV
jgi:hypothetical protein